MYEHIFQVILAALLMPCLCWIKYVPVRQRVATHLPPQNWLRLAVHTKSPQCTWRPAMNVMKVRAKLQINSYALAISINDIHVTKVYYTELY